MAGRPPPRGSGATYWSDPAAHGLHGLHAAAHGLHGLHPAAPAAQGLHGLQALHAAAAHGLQPPSWLSADAGDDMLSAASTAIGRTVVDSSRLRVDLTFFIFSSTAIC